MGSSTSTQSPVVLRRQLFAENIAALRTRQGSAVVNRIKLKCHTIAGDGGHGPFRWKSGAAPGTYKDDNGLTIVPTGGDGSAAWVRDFSGAVNVRAFGARGDGTGATPASEGTDISTAPWNTWDGTPFKDNLPWSPYGTGGTFVPDRAVPFANDDTWDYIGASLALWARPTSKKTTYFPAGNYKINLLSATAKGAYNGLLIMKGQEQSIVGDGPYESVITTNENAAFFAGASVGVKGAFKLFTPYRVGGPPTNVAKMLFSGPDSYGSGNANLDLIHCQNINGMTFSDLWLVVGDRGIYAEINSGDSHIKGVTTEFLFSASVYTDATSDFSIDFCNFWASASVAGQRGVDALGRTSVTNSRFIGFDGVAAKGATGVFCNNYVVSEASPTNAVTFADSVTISGNQFTGEALDSVVSVVKNATVTSNIFNQTSNHACVNMGGGSAGSATNIVVTGNTFIKTNAAVEDQNYAVVAVDSGVSFTGAATESCIVTGNTFQGRALQTIGNAVITRNTFDGVLQSEIFTKAVNFKSSITRESDVIGKLIMEGSGATNPFTVTVTGMLGIGDGSERAQQRVNLVGVYTSGPSHVGQAFALYTSDYLGNAILIATLGSNVVGGGITFGVSGPNPQITVNNSGGTVNYKINAVPLV